MRKKTLGWVWLCVFAFFNTVPLFAISVLANLNAVCTVFSYIFRLSLDMRLTV